MRRVRVAAGTSGTFYGVTMTAGNIYTVAGTGSAGLSGDGGPGTGAQLSWPSSVASDGGNLLIVDSFNERIRLLSGSWLGSKQAGTGPRTATGPVPAARSPRPQPPQPQPPQPPPTTPPATHTGRPAV
jgi:hypothetical protein